MIPVTQGKLQTAIADMAVGDYITAKYTTTAMNTHGTFSDIGTVDTTQISAFSSSNLTGYLYLIKIAKGILCPNARLYSGVTYSTMNADNRIYGKKVTIGSRDFLIRVPRLSEYLKMNGTLDGKIAVADVNNNFGVNTAATEYEVIQENNNLGQMVFLFNTSGGASSANATACYARCILEYVDDPKCTDLYH